MKITALVGVLWAVAIPVSVWAFDFRFLFTDTDLRRMIPYDLAREAIKACSAIAEARGYAALNARSPQLSAVQINDLSPDEAVVVGRQYLEVIGRVAREKNGGREPWWATAVNDIVQHPAADSTADGWRCVQVHKDVVRGGFIVPPPPQVQELSPAPRP